MQEFVRLCVTPSPSFRRCRISAMSLISLWKADRPSFCPFHPQIIAWMRMRLWGKIISRCSKTRNFQGDFRTRKIYLNINWLQGRFVAIVTKITFFVPTFVTKTESRTSSILMRIHIIGLKEKEWRFRGIQKSVTKRWCFNPWKASFLILNHSKIKSLPKDSLYLGLPTL